MTELSQTERMALRRIINLLPAIEKQFGVGEYLDDDKIIKYVQPQPQPVATLCEVVEPLLKRCSDMAKNDDVCGCEQDHICGLPEFCREIDNVRRALAAERKRAVLVNELIDAVRRFYQENDGRYDLLRVRLNKLDAFDKGTENG